MNGKLRSLVVMLAWAWVAAASIPRAWSAEDATELSGTDQHELRNADGYLQKVRQRLEEGQASGATSELKRARDIYMKLARKYGKNQSEVARLFKDIHDLAVQVQAKPKESRHAMYQRMREEKKAAQAAEREGGLEAKMARHKAREIETLLGAAKKASDLAETAPQEIQRRNNLRKAQSALREAEEKLADIEGSSEPNGPEVQRLQAMRDDIRREFHSKHGAEIEAQLAGVKAPQNLYRGSDRSELESRIRDLWMKIRPKDKLLGIRFDQGDWVHGTATTTEEEMISANAHLITETTEAEDYLRVSVVVKNSDKIASIYHVTVYRDPKSHKSQMGFGDHSSGQFAADMLIANFK